MDIKQVREYKYLGVTLADIGLQVARKERLMKARQWWGRLCSVSKQRLDK